MTKSGPISLLKLIAELRSGATIGALYIFTLAKSYFLFQFGVGKRLAVISLHFGINLMVMAIGVKLITLPIFLSVFAVYFGEDRS